MRKWRSHLVQTFQFASRSFFQMTWRQSSHFTHSPSVRTRFSAVASISSFSRLNQDIRAFLVFRFWFLEKRASNQERETYSVLDAALRQHAFLICVLYLLHLGHRVGELDDRRVRVASSQYYMHLLWFGLQSRHHLGGIEHFVPDGVIDLVENDQVPLCGLDRLLGFAPRFFNHADVFGIGLRAADFNEAA